MYKFSVSNNNNKYGFKILFRWLRLKSIWNDSSRYFGNRLYLVESIVLALWFHVGIVFDIRLFYIESCWSRGPGSTVQCVQSNSSCLIWFHFQTNIVGKIDHFKTCCKINETLTWNDHINTIYIKVSRSLGIICEASVNLPKGLMLTSYFSFIQQYYDYSNIRCA